jgi:enamine deaminase RidA (YjgF/YER057c/UK114 family)
MGTRNVLFEKAARDLGVDFDQEIRAVPKYEVAVENDGVLYVAGQLPRIGSSVAVKGRVGAETTVDDARRAARICVVRALAIVRQALGSLDRVKKVLRVTVYVQSAEDFTQQSEVADAASEILYSVLSPVGGHTRTSVGVYQLPKNASVEIDMIVAIAPK